MFVSSSIPADMPLLEAVALYVAETRAYVRNPSPASLARLDAAFAQLRDQSGESPGLRACVDKAGLAACDLVRALERGAVEPRVDTRQWVVANDLAMARIVEALAPLNA